MTKQPEPDRKTARDRPNSAPNPRQLDCRKPSRLCFYTEADALNYFDKLGKDFSCWLRPEKRSISEDYIDGNVYLKVVFRPPLKAHVGQLSALIVPDIASFNSGLGNSSASKGNAACARSERLQYPVYFAVPELVELPKGFFPSLVRLETQEERANGLGDLRVLVAVEIFKRIPLGFPEGELGVFGVWIPTNNASAVINNVVKRRPEAIHNIESNSGQFLAWRTGFDLKEVLSRIRISLTESSVWIFGDKDALKMVELVQVLSRPFQQEPRAAKGFEHD